MIAAIIQARTASTRLPGKVFKTLAGKPLIAHVVERLKPSQLLNRILIATTDTAADNELVEWCQENDVPVFRGNENNVLDRYYQAAKSIGAKTIVRITADDPFKDYQLMDKVITHLQEQQLDFAFNNKPATYPEGLDIEVFTFEALERAHQAAQDPFELEHMTQHFFRNPQSFKQGNVGQTENLSALRWTIDTEADYNMASKVYGKLYRPGKIFLTSEILELLKANPEIQSINQNVARSHMHKGR